MAMGFGLLRLSPDVFWRMTPREFAHAARWLSPRQMQPPDRAVLRDLMQQFPDQEGQELGQ